MTSTGYDDGRLDIPGAIAGPVERVVVIGAGISGLTVANALGEAGVECVVVEARDRLGGRLHTLDLAGMPVDLGGSWIHHPQGNPLRRFARDAGVECGAGDPMPDVVGYDLAEARLLSSAEIEQVNRLALDAFPEWVEGNRGGFDPSLSAAAGAEAYLREQDLPGQDGRRARQALRAVIEADSADRWDRQSLRWLWTEDEYEGELFGDLPVGGYRSVVDAMAAGVSVRTGFVTADVVVEGDATRVTSTDGDVEAGSHVVVAVPLGVLKQDSITFSPDLPDDLRFAIDRVGFGRYEKVCLVFDEAFWRPAGRSHTIFFPEQSDLPAGWMFDLDAFGAGPGLALHLFSSAADAMLARPAADVVRDVVQMVSAVVGTAAPPPAGAWVTDWAHDRFTLGAYTHLAPGTEPSLIDSLGAPAHGRVLFAGEHTQKARMGYADGAMTSGIREAKRLLGAETVALNTRCG